MKLRREDFAIWDYYKRSKWSEIKQALRDGGNEEILAWAMKRANARGLYAINERAPFLAWMMAIGIVAFEAEKNIGHSARATIRQLMRVTKPEDKDLLRKIAMTVGGRIAR